MTRHARRILAVTLSAIALSALSADPYHYVNTFIGDRAAGMAGAYTAIADGPEGMYYNPAGLAFAPANYVSVSTNAFEFRTWTFKDIEDTGVDFQRESFTFVPNFFGFIQRGRNIVWGFTILSPDAEAVNLRDRLVFPPFDVNGTQITQNKYYNEDRELETTYLGPSFGVLAADTLGVGVTLLAGYDSFELLQREIDRYVDPSASPVLQTQTEVTSNSQTLWLAPQVGIQFVPSSAISIGLTTKVRAPVYRVSESITNSTTFGSTATPLASLPIVSTESVADGVFAPVEITARTGVAWFAGPRLVVAADGSFVYPINPADTDDDSLLLPTWNASVGAEYFLTGNFPLRVGLFTNNANTPDVDIISDSDFNALTTAAAQATYINQVEHVDLYGATASIGFATADLMLNIGGMFSYGSGYGQIIGGTNDVQVLNRVNGAVFVSGGYQF